MSLEERLIGEESPSGVVDGKHLVPMPLVQDHKRAYEGDVGANTGGMGSYPLRPHASLRHPEGLRGRPIMEDTVGHAGRGTPCGSSAARS